jgi:hypothetical protein
MISKIPNNTNISFNKVYINLELPDDRFSGCEVTLNFPARIGMNEAAAAEAVRIRVAADAAARHVAPVATAPGSDRNDRQSLSRPELAHVVRGPAGTETHRDLRSGSAPVLLRRGTNAFFITQWIAQEGQSDAQPRTPHAHGAARYPSMSFDDDILLPGETFVHAEDRPRLDITV